MINLEKNDIIDKVLRRNYETYKITQDTGEYVPDEVNRKIYIKLYKNLLKQLRAVDKEDRRKRREDKKALKLKAKEKGAQ